MNGEPLPASDLPAMEAAFDKAKLNTLRIDGTRIRVPRGQQAAYMAALADAKALPHNFGTPSRRGPGQGQHLREPRATQAADEARQAGGAVR